MQPQTVVTVLKSYKYARGRCSYLKVRVNALERLAQQQRDDEIESMALSGGSNDGMPRPSTPGQPTERIAMSIVSGSAKLDRGEAQRQLELARTELAGLTVKIDTVNAWLTGLSERERWIVRHQLIEGEYWRDVLSGFERRFGEAYSKDGLKALKARAIEKICGMSR